MITLLLGIFLAALIFSALLVAGYQATLVKGRARYAHLATIAATIALMAAISNENAIAMILGGGGLTMAALVTSRVTPGWSKLFPLILVVFGAVILLSTI